MIRLKFPQITDADRLAKLRPPDGPIDVTSHLHAMAAEIDQTVLGRAAIGDYPARTFKGYDEASGAWSKEIWDVAAIAYLLNGDWVPSNITASPIISERQGFFSGEPGPYARMGAQTLWSFDQGRHAIRWAYDVDPDPIFHDLFSKLARWADGGIQIAV